ncbi:cytochrome P450 [Paraphaeosphaeria sporulosa]|uniref:Cytochrome P450 n=1 Tax=Paraphaeosphaeria sporulosa TaxID=1460663 RepID=A0A177C978_9PLEO|nr:cytochrome P450 [Paraphaeosphaeria sporulosa]OAG04304.1 cytochrome P450 [Paraphaeosphaeria sporulosa]
MIDLSRKKSRYYVELWEQSRMPACTIRLPGARLYVINETSLIPSVQRQYKTLAFPPLQAKLAMNVCGSSQTANDILNTNVNGDEGFWGYSITHYKAIHPPLFPGPGLDAMNRVMAQKITTSLERIQSSEVFRLFDFVKREVTRATTDSVYGDQNPFRDPAIVEAFWEFQEGVMGLLMGLPPSFVRDSFNAREFMAKRFVQYFNEGGHEQGSALIKARYAHSMEHKIPVEDIARFETAGAIAILTNTSPACFWLLYHLYSSPSALEDCRRELGTILSENTNKTQGGGSGITITLDLTQAKTSCPTLLSSLQEVLRLHSVGISTRQVMEDHILDGKYLLKKGGTVMIPAPVQHQDAATWGANVHSFDHRRFFPSAKRPNPIAFRGFGGGTTLCPGRHFASTEIFAFTALMILRFDMHPVDGKWKELTTNKASLWEVTPRPDEDLVVKLIPRDGFDLNVKWEVLVTDSDKSMPLAAEDMDALRHSE